MYEKKGCIKTVEVFHKTPTSFMGDKGWEPLPTRWVVWARVDFDRVWLRTVIDDGNERDIKLRSRSLIVREFFNDLIGREIRYAEQYGKSEQSCQSVQESSLPETCLLEKFSDIKAWFDENHPERLGDDVEVLRKKAAEKRKTTREGNKRKIEDRKKEMDDRVAKFPDRYLKATFQRGINPKNQWEQWEFRKDGKLYVLHHLDARSVSKGPIYVEVDRELIPGRIILVRRMR